MTTISGRLGLQGTIVIEGTALRWNITAPTPSNFTYGSSAMIPLVGDWNGDGVEGIGAYEPSTGVFFLKQTATGGDADITVQFGSSNLTPISWYDTEATPEGDRIGVIQENIVYLDTDFLPGAAEISTTIDRILCYTLIIKQCTYIPITHLSCKDNVCTKITGPGEDTCTGEGTSCTYIQPPSDNTLFYIGIAAAGLAVIYLITKKK